MSECTSLVFLLGSWLCGSCMCVCMCSTRCRFRVVEVKQAQKQHQSVSLWLLSTEACYFRCIVTFFSSFIFQYSPIAFFIKCNSILHIERIRWATTTTATTATYSMAIIAFPLVCAILISHTQCVSFVQREEKIDIVDFILKFAYSEWCSVASSILSWRLSSVLLNSAQNLMYTSFDVRAIRFVVNTPKFSDFSVLSNCLECTIRCDAMRYDSLVSTLFS